MTSRSLASAFCLLWLSAVSTAQSPSLEPLARAVQAGAGSFALRYRYEHVDQDGIDREANASTANGETGYPVVADPEGFDLNLAFVTHRRDSLTLTGGRQRILHGDQRFVGGVGWRQNEQTFDALRVESRLAGMEADYAYVTNVNRIFGPDDGAQPADWRSDSHLLRLDWPVSEALRFGAFGYLMDFDNDNGPASANATAGLEAAASLGVWKLEAALARQTDYADNPLDYGAWYGRVQAALTAPPTPARRG